MSKFIRKWPYPFEAGLTISNDVEFMNFDYFETLMCFLNSRKQTALGRGLGIEVTSSMFHFSANPYNFSIFNGAIPNAQLSSHSDRLKEYLQTGWIDTLHAYGDFDHVGGFEREHALRCVEYLQKIGVSIKIFSNHGGIENIQNVGRDADYHRGDCTGHAAYHTDLWQEAGIDFVWTDSMVTHTLTPPSLLQKLDTYRRWLRSGETTSYFTPRDTSSIKKILLNDGLAVYGFRRFRGTGPNAPNLSSLGYQLSQIPWQKFYKNSDGIVIYQHLGVLDRINCRCAEATLDAVRQRPEVYLAPFHFLAREYVEGRLWVAGCARFLNYLRVRDEIKVSYGQDGRMVLHSHMALTTPDESLQGLTIYIDPTNFSGLFYGEIEVPVNFNGPDATGQYSLTVPIQKLPCIWN